MKRIGIDIGGTNTTIGLVSSKGKIICRKRLSTDQFSDPNLFSAAIAQTIKYLCIESSIEPGQIKGIGIGAPNGNYFSGCIEFAPNLRFTGVVPLVSLLSPHFPTIPIVLTNDANAAALGEHEFGIAKGIDDFILITLGTGVGSGLFANGRLIYGHDGFAGEIGHTILYLNGRPCGCGRQGCLESYTSARGLVETARELLIKSQAQSMLRQISYDKLTAKDIGEAAMNGDTLASKTFNHTAMHLALGLANAVAHTSPEVVILFGGLIQAGKVFLDPLTMYFERYLLNIYKGKVKILVSGLAGEEAAILGAASLIEINH